MMLVILWAGGRFVNASSGEVTGARCSSPGCKPSAVTAAEVYD